MNNEERRYTAHLLSPKGKRAYKSPEAGFSSREEAIADAQEHVPVHRWKGFKYSISTGYGYSGGFDVRFHDFYA